MRKKFTTLILIVLFQFGLSQVYCDSSSGSTEAVMTKVSFAGINNPSTNAPFSVPGYEDFTNITGNAVKEESYNFRVEGNTNGNYIYYVSLFIDWNDNGVLNDEGEFYDLGIIQNSTGSDGTHVSRMIAIPDAAAIGNTRIRVLMNWSYSNTNPCGSYGYGQTEDYTLNISDPLPLFYCDTEITNTVAPITQVNFAGINNTSTSSSSGYEDFFNISGSAEKGSSKAIHLKGNSLGNNTDYYTAFIDLNRDGDFTDAGESFQLGTLSNTTGEDDQKLSSFITIPTTATRGKSRLRIIKNRGSYATDPCGNYANGQIEDYGLIIADAVFCIPGVTNSVNPVTRVVIADMDNSSPALSQSPYEQFYEVEGILRHGDEYEIQLEGNTGGNNIQYFTVFMDWNQNGVFGESGEIFEIGSLTNSTGTDGQSVIGNIPVLYSAKLGKTRMRIISNRGTSPVNPCGIYQNGQIEDYLIDIQEPIPAEGACQEGISGSLETSLNTTGFMLANDFVVEPLTKFIVDRFIVNIQRSQLLSANIVLMEDDTNKPGAVIATFDQVAPMVQTYIGNEYHRLIFQLPSSVELSGGLSGKKYWIAIKGQLEDPTNLAMMETTSNITTSLVHYSLNNGTTYSPWPGLDGVFTVSGVCEEDIVEYCDVEITENVEAITLVKFAGIDNPTSATSTDGYEFFEDMEASVEQGDFYDITFEGNTNGNHTNYFTVFIDWNQNGYLNEAGEVFEIGTLTNSTGTDGQQLIGNFQIPENAQLGATKMRIIKNRGTFPIDPCGTYENGQVEDYTIKIGLDSDLDCEITFTENVAPITRLVFAGINNSSSAETTSPQHELFLEIEGIAKRGLAYAISIEGNTLGNNTSFFSVFIDWNQNGQLDDMGEIFWLSGFTNSTGTDGTKVTGNITIPEDAVLGATRMRIIKFEGDWIPAACGTFEIGQAEDYTLVITDAISDDDYCMVKITQDVQPITHVIFAGIDNTSPGDNFAPHHEYFLDQTGQVARNQTYPIRVEAPEGGGVTVFIDWNQNNVLDDQGEVYDLINGLGANSFITVPVNAHLGSARMRVVKYYFTNPQDPCGSYSHGQAEDYTLEVVGEDYCDIVYPSNNLEDGLGIIIADFKVANDFTIDANTSFTITNFIPNIITRLDYGHISIHEDDNGKPGEVIALFEHQYPVSQEFIGNNFWWNAEFYTVDFKLPVPVTLDGGETGKKYWIALGGAALNWPNTHAMAWETTSLVYSDETYYSNDGGQTWEINAFNMDGVFKLVGECEGVDLNCGENYEGNNYEMVLNTFNGSANDFDVEPNTTFELLKFSPTVWFNLNQVDIQIFTNNETEGGPGTLIRSYNNITPDLSTWVHTDPDSGFNYYKLDFTLNPVLLPGGENGTKYWIAILPVEGQDPVFWEMSSIMTTSEPAYNQGIELTSGEWFWNRIEESYDGVFEIYGNCIGETLKECSLECPEDIVIEVESNQTTAVVEYEVDFGCEGIGNTEGLAIVLVSGLASGDEFPVGTTTVIHNLVYDGEILDTCSFTVTVEENLETIDLNNNKFTYYPNPVKDVLSISSEKEIVKVEIYNMTGQKINSQLYRSKSLNLNINWLSSGLYIFKVKLETGKIETFKIMKK